MLKILPKNMPINLSDTAVKLAARDPRAPGKERARRRVVVYVFWIYWLLIFEGALRKWAFPQFHEIIFFARDPIVLFAYFVAWRNHLVKRDALLTAGIGIALLFVLLVVFQSFTIDVNPLALLYGWRQYFLYIPLMFVIKDTFNLEDISKLVRWTLYVSVPLTPLIYFQYMSSPSSFINAGYSTGGVFIVANNIVRTTGTFTFTAGQTMFASSLIAMLIIAWLNRTRLRLISFPGLIIATAAGVTTLLLSGSRTAFFVSGLVVAAAFFGLLLTPGYQRKIKGVVILLVLFVFSILLFVGPFKKSFEALNTRFEQAETAEGSPIRRAFAPLIIFTNHIFTAPVIGYGLGYGTSGGSLLATGKMHIPLAEDDWSRIIMESGPVLGLVYVGYRIFFVVAIFSRCIRRARSGNLLPMIFFGFIGFYMLAGNITQSGTVHGYNWVFMGLTMAAAKKPKVLDERQT